MLYRNESQDSVSITFDQPIEGAAKPMHVTVTKIVKPGDTIELPDHMTKAPYPGRKPPVEDVAPQLKPYAPEKAKK